MSGGSSISYGNIKNSFLLQVSIAPTSIVTYGSVQTFTVPGLILNDDISVSRTSSTVNAAASQPYVGIQNSRVTAANTMEIVFSNSSTAAVTVPAENYIIEVNRCDAVGNVPPSGFWA